MTSKFFQTNHQNRWLSTEVVGARGLVTESLELAVKVVAPAIGLPMFTFRVVSPVTRPPTLVNKMVPSIIEPLATGPLTPVINAMFLAIELLATITTRPPSEVAKAMSSNT